MTTAELIAALREIDPEGTSEVDIYICRRYGGYQRAAARVRRFLSNGNVKITDEPDEEA